MIIFHQLSKYCNHYDQSSHCRQTDISFLNFGTCFWLIQGVCNSDKGLMFVLTSIFPRSDWYQMWTRLLIRIFLLTHLFLRSYKILSKELFVRRLILRIKYINTRNGILGYTFINIWIVGLWFTITSLLWWTRIKTAFLWCGLQQNAVKQNARLCNTGWIIVS